MIYLASPYSHKYFWIRWWRYIQTCRAAARLMKQGKLVYSPIAHSHPVFFWGGVFGARLPYDFNYWQDHNRWHITRCEVLYVLCLPGWQQSKGVAAEVDYAQQQNLAVFYLDKEKL